MANKKPPFQCNVKITNGNRHTLYKAIEEKNLNLKLSNKLLQNSDFFLREF